MQFSKGSEWRKWDLHIHTPVSIVQHYGGDTDDIWDKFITDLEKLPEEFGAIGINDYLFIDGYKRVIDFKNSGRLKNDAEQVIVASNEGENLSYFSGSLENPTIREKICDVLEGGKEAFRKREQKYGFR